MRHCFFSFWNSYCSNKVCILKIRISRKYLAYIKSFDMPSNPEMSSTHKTAKSHENGAIENYFVSLYFVHINHTKIIHKITNRHKKCNCKTNSF